MKLLDQVRNVIRKRHYSIRTEQAYGNWIIQYTIFHKKRHPKDMEGWKISQFIWYVAIGHKAASSILNLACNAILFYHNEVLGMDGFDDRDAMGPKGINDCPDGLW